MKLIEALKLSKELAVKADDLRKKIAGHSAHLSIETPVYPDQKSQVRSWLQAHEGVTREIAALRLRIAKTNLSTQVPITFPTPTGTISKSIVEWVIRRRELAKFDELAWACLTDRNLKEQAVKPTPESPVTTITIIRCYDPVERDNKIELYRTEPGLIDRTLEVVNAVTDLLE